jgi:hypothetical protein
LAHPKEFPDEFPETQLYKKNLEYQYFEASRQLADSVYRGSLDAAVQQWVQSLNIKITEVDNLLEIAQLYKTRVDISGYRAIAYIILYSALMIAIMYFILRAA